MVVLFVLALAVGTSAAICQVWNHMRAIELGYKISKRTREHTRLVEINRRLKIELALYKNPARITPVATEELRMAPPRPDQIRRLLLHGPAGRGSPPDRTGFAVRRSAASAVSRITLEEGD